MKRRKVLSQKPSKTRAPAPEAATGLNRGHRRPRRTNGKSYAHGAAARRDAATGSSLPAQGSTP